MVSNDLMNISPSNICLEDFIKIVFGRCEHNYISKSHLGQAYALTNVENDVENASKYCPKYI